MGGTPRCHGYSLLDLRDELGLEALGREQRLGRLTVEQELVLRQLEQEQPDDLPQIHPADHLLEAAGGKRWNLRLPGRRRGTLRLRGAGLPTCGRRG